LMEVEQRLQWMNAFYIVINEIQTLYLMVVNDGLLSAPARLLREQKVALEVILKELK